jgi:ABC-type Zn2+ transport system substrate-binding protein/surface adhesin
MRLLSLLILALLSQILAVQAHTETETDHHHHHHDHDHNHEHEHNHEHDHDHSHERELAVEETNIHKIMVQKVITLTRADIVFKMVDEQMRPLPFLA